MGCWRLVLAAVLLLASGAARAEDDGLDARGVIRRAGLEGVWAADCTRPASSANRYVRWVVPRRAGPVEQWVNRGGGFALSAWVVAAERLPEGRVALRARTEDGWRWTGVAQRVGDKLREVDIVGTFAGQTFHVVSGGRDLRTNQDTPLISRCDGEVAAAP